MMGVLSILLLLAAVGLSLLGCSFLALSQAKHARAVIGGRALEHKRQRSLRARGWVFVAFSFVPCVIRDGWGFAALSWSLIIAGAALTIAMLLAYRPSSLQVLYKYGSGFLIE